MSLFIGALAFPGAVDSPEQVEIKIGVLGGSVLSAVVGGVILAVAGHRRKDLAEERSDTVPN
jgi:NhaA family Na+:H+ antiporter